MKRWLLILALLLSVGLNLGIFGTLIIKRAQARRFAFEAGGQGGPQLERLADRLQLEGTERLGFIEAQRRFMATIRREGRLLRRDQQALRQQLTSRTPEAERVEELVSATAKRAEALDRAFARNVLYVREILDGPREQRYVQFLAQMYSRERRGGERPRAPGRR